MKKYIKLFVADIVIAIVAVILYSPGLLCLRVTDESILRAGMSILGGLGLLALFLFLNIRVLIKPKIMHIEPDEIYDLEKAKAILKRHTDSKLFGGIAKTASGQLDRILKSQNRIADAIKRKFVEGTMSWEKFYSIVNEAEESTIRNVITMSNRMSIFDEAEYARLQNYKEDDIPDDIQEEQLRLYHDNYESVKSILALNEKILLKLDALTIELSSFENNANEEMNSDILDEIEKLMQDAKYYQ